LRKLLNEEIGNFCLSPSIRVIKSRRMGRTGLRETRGI